MKWTRRKNDDGLTEYVSGPYVLVPCHNGFCHADLPKVQGWDIKFGDKWLRYNGKERQPFDGSGTFAYTVRLLPDAKRVAEDHALEQEVLKLGREQPLEPERARRLYRKVLLATGIPAEEVDGRLERLMKERGHG